MRLNACELEIELFCRGLRIPSDDLFAAGRGVRRTRPGLGSGLELVIPTGSRLKPAIWMNAPVVEPFVQASPFVLDRAAGDYAICDQRSGRRYAVRLPDAPDWYHRHTVGGTPMSRIGVLQGTYLAIYIRRVAARTAIRRAANVPPPHAATPAAI